MDPLRHFRPLRRLGRFVLLWWMLSLGVAMASPLIQPRALELVCSSHGVVKVLIKADDGQQARDARTADCPLCVSIAPPPVDWLVFLQSFPQGRVIQAIPAPSISITAALPLPRGPPPAA